MGSDRRGAYDDGVEVDPPDFIEASAAAEGWDESDLVEWETIRGVLDEQFGVTHLTLMGDGRSIAAYSRRRPVAFADIADVPAKPTLRALREISKSLLPRYPPYRNGERVEVNLRDLDKPEGVGERETGTLVEVDVGFGTAVVQLTSVPPMASNFVTVPLDRVRPVDR